MKKLVGIIVVVLVLLVIAGAANQNKNKKPGNNNQPETTQPARSGGELDDVLNKLEGSFEGDTVDDEALIDAVDDESTSSIGEYEI